MKTFFIGIGSLLLSCFAIHPLFATNEIPIITTILGDDDGGTEPKFVADENCEIHITQILQAINLERYRVNRNTPLNVGEIFYLPSSYPPMAFVYTIGNTTDTIFVNHFYYQGTELGPNGPVEVFNFPIDITIDVSAGCQEAVSDGIKSFNMDFELNLIDASSLNNGGEIMAYPLCLFNGPDDAFSCDFFDYCSTNGTFTVGSGSLNLCTSAWTSRVGDFEVVCDPYCSGQQSFNGGSPAFRKIASSQDNTTGIQLSPNPFNDRVEIQLRDFSDFPLQGFEVYSIHGELLDRTIVSPGNEFQTSTTLELGHLPAGIYLLRVNQGEKTQTLKLIKQ